MVPGVADDAQPSGVQGTPAAPALDPKVVPKPALRIELARHMLGLGYTPDQVINWLERPGILPEDLARDLGISPRKEWRIGRTAARSTLDRALETAESEVAAPKSRKQARTRAMLTMVFQKAMALINDNPGKAAGLLNAAVAAADKIARIDGAYAYDGSLLLPSGIQPASPEEAARIIAHAQATLDLAKRRGVLSAKPIPPPVIDATAVDVEVDGEDTPDEIPREPSGDTN